MGFRRVGAVGLGLLLCGVVMGGKEHRLVERWTDPEFEHRRFSKLIVLGIAQDDQARRNFENLFVSHLRGKQIECVTSYSLVPDLTDVDEAERQLILQAIGREQFDGAISVRVVPLKGLTEQEWHTAWRQQIVDLPTLRQLIEESLPVPDSESKQYGVEVALWDVTHARRVWAARTDPYTPKQMRKGAGEFVRFTMHALEIDDLMKGSTPNRKPVSQP